MRFIGDIHGKMGEYMFLTDGCKEFIQVGDFGAGFVDLFDMPTSHRFIRGNHDSPEVCREHPNWIADGTVEGNMFFLGGAWSIDHNLRVPGVSWWADEELSWLELDATITKYEEAKPDIMVTHDCPADVITTLFPGGDPRNSRTQNALHTMFEIHQPKVWIFGHWHENRDMVINGCRFICLAELSYIDLDIAKV